MSEIAGDAEDGAVRYDLKYTDSGNDAGGFVVYWNTTAYADPEDAWDNDVLFLLHGMGIDATAAGNIFSLLVKLLTFSLPDVPILIGIIIGVLPWACIVYLCWFIIKESLPFL
jgi:hypothetical protein